MEVDTVPEGALVPEQMLRRRSVVFVQCTVVQEDTPRRTSRLRPPNRSPGLRPRG